MITTLYTDRTIVVAVKPCGVPSQRDKTNDDAMPELLEGQLSTSVHPVHRLDRAVGGIMVFALTRRAAGLLSEAIGTDAFVKEYLAVVHGTPKSEVGEWKDYLLHDTVRNMTKVFPEPTSGAKEAILSYRYLGASQDGAFSLLRVRLGTGRTHQIRAQLAFHGMPIAGDGKYGAHDPCGIALFSHRLAFSHPITGKPMSFSRLPDRIMPWNLFTIKELI